MVFGTGKKRGFFPVGTVFPGWGARNVGKGFRKCRIGRRWWPEEEEEGGKLVYFTGEDRRLSLQGGE